MTTVASGFVRHFVRWCDEYDVGVGLCHLHDQGRPCVKDDELDELLHVYDASTPMAGESLPPPFRRISSEKIETIGTVGPFEVTRVGLAVIVDVRVDGKGPAQLSTGEVAGLHNLLGEALVAVRATTWAPSDSDIPGID